MKQLRSPVSRYFGGKWRLAPWIIEHLPAHDRYVEPFGGMGSVLLQKKPSKIEVFNDIDSKIANLFRILRDPKLAKELGRLIALTPYSREEFVRSYEYAEDPLESARRFLVRLGMAINPESPGMFKSTGFRVSYGGHTTHSGSVAAAWRAKPHSLKQIAGRLLDVIIENEPAEKLIRRYDSPVTLFYCDPPYLPSTRSSSGRYGYEMSLNDHEHLIDVLNAVKGSVVISGYANPLYDSRLNWTRFERADHSWKGGDRVEVIWVKNAA